MTMPGGILRGRVGTPPLVPSSNRVLSAGGVLRGRVGDDDPREYAKLLRDELEEDDTDDAIDAGDQQLAAQGLTPEQRIDRYTEQGKKHAVGRYASRVQEIRKQATDERSRAEAEAAENDRTQRFFALVADIGTGLAGGNPTAQERLQVQRERKRQEALARADATERRGLDDLRIEREFEREFEREDRAEEDEGAEADYIEQLLRGSGYPVPEGGARSNPRAFAKVFRPIVASRLDAEAGQRTREQRREDDFEDFQREEDYKADKRGQRGPDPASFNSVLGARNAYQRHTKSAFQVIDSAKKIETALAQGGGIQDIAALYGLIRNLDPESVVREGEVSLTQSGISKLGRLQLLGQKIVEDRTLTDKQRAEILQLTRSIVQETETVQRDYEANTRRLATDYGIPPEQLITRSLAPDAEVGSPGAPAPAARRAAGGSQASDTAREIKRAFRAGEIDEGEALRRLEEIEDAEAR